MTLEAASVRVRCRACGTEQELTADGIEDDTEVACSNCRSALGTWRELKAAGRTANVLAARPR